MYNLVQTKYSRGQAKTFLQIQGVDLMRIKPQTPREGVGQQVLWVFPHFYDMTSNLQPVSFEENHAGEKAGVQGREQLWVGEPWSWKTSLGHYRSRGFPYGVLGSEELGFRNFNKVWEERLVWK